MLQNKETLIGKINEFNRLTGSDVDAIPFFEKIEARSKELAPFHEDSGWMMACHEAVVGIFEESYLDKLVKGQKPLVESAGDFIKLFDEYVMKPYVLEREKQGEPMDISSSYGAYNSPSSIKSISDLINSKTIPSLKDETLEKFKSGELTIDMALDFVENQKKAYYTTNSYFMLGSYADAIDNIHKNRSFLDMLRDIPTYFKEWRAIRTIRNMIKKNSNPEWIEADISKERKNPALDDTNREINR